jgi:hypothetical protein
MGLTMGLFLVFLLIILQSLKKNFKTWKILIKFLHYLPQTEV